MKCLDYDVVPMVLPVSATKQFVTVSPGFEHSRRKLDKVNSVKVLAVNSPVELNGCLDSWEAAPQNAFTRLEDGSLRIEAICDVEDEYAIWLKHIDEHGREETVEVFGLYALEEDLFAFRPYKGDLHLHSIRSDGRHSPIASVTAGRGWGFDFMALTDHKLYAPSLEVIEQMGKFDTEFLLVPGEEVHIPNNMTHIINFGGSASVNDYYHAHPVTFAMEECRYEEGLPDTLPAATRFQIGASEWAFDKIREYGGIALFCHPFWRPHLTNHNYLGEDAIDVLLEHGKFDAVELGNSSPSNLYGNQITRCRYLETCVKNGRWMPVVGVSDSHHNQIPNGVDEEVIPSPLGLHYTLVFARDLSFQSIADAIRSGRSLAISRSKGTFPDIFGPFRLCKLAYFLCRDFFPRHDWLCRLEAELLLGAISGRNPNGAAQVSLGKTLVSDYIADHWKPAFA